jgi:hypothetical protein
MMTFFELLGHWGGVEGVASDAGPATGTHLSMLAIELPHYVTPAVAGLTVGSVVGVVGFIAVMLLVGRKDRSRRKKRAYDERLFIQPYATMQRDTPMPPRAFQPSYGSPAFVPSNALSARAFAKMGYAADSEPDLALGSDPSLAVEIDMDEPSGPVANAPSAPAITVSPVVVLSGERDKEKSAPHPLGIIKSTSTAMQAAPIADLSFDDSPTEIGETYFDEPPQPRRRTDPPRIRKIAPAKPRFSDQTRGG